MTWPVLGSRVVYDNPWIRVREDQVVRPDPARGIYGVVDVPDTVLTQRTPRKLPAREGRMDR